ncbi:B-cell lymphoma 3 protein [Pangasianodon hypophthalmus]|uniref:B-cell lymphoma 3 protein n=1 Tax=Pangasianodon hypophthalmus TaxID=310915 RepID=UPI0023078A57|nr:B-cell lymphoma 3 protein [Pangasianodon hypophthalmus]
MTMTMSGVHTEASAPLDLRTTTRDITDRTTGQTKTREIVDRTPKIEEVECTSRGSPSFSSAIKPGSKECKDSHGQAFLPSNVKCERLTDSDGKWPETSTSKLPIRKRPVRQDHKPLDQSESTVGEPPAKVLKTDSSPSPAKVPKCSRVRNGLNAETRQFVPSPVPAGAQSDLHLAATTPSYLTYGPSPVYTSRLPQLHPFEDTDRLRHEVDLATHQDEDGDTALHIAVAQEKEAVVHWLIHILRQARKDLDLYNNLRQTPLHLAVITHQPGVVEALLQGGADPEALDRNGQTALHLCCEHQQDACLRVILSHLSRLPCCPSACLNSRNFEGLTPLHLAVQDGNKKLAKMLLDSGADINAVDIKSGRSPLIYAVEKSCMEMINFLVENGCNVNAQSYSGNTALHIACGRGEVEAVRVLLKNGADSSLKNYHNDTAVMVAKNKKVSDVLRGKPTRGHSLKTQNSFNGTPSPNNLSLSPLATPNPLRSASLSPTVPRTYSPHSQSGESRSGNLSPVEMQEAEDLQMPSRTFHDVVAVNNADYLVSIHPFPFFQAPCYDTFMPSGPHIHLMSGHSPYYPNVVHSQPSDISIRRLYPSDTQFILIPTRNGPPVSRRSPSHPTGTQSRPSSHNSDQSDISNLSASTGEKT